MRSRTVHVGADASRDEKEHRIGEFIRHCAGNIEEAHDEAVLMVAQSSDSPVARALIAAGPALAARAVEARIILASLDHDLEPWFAQAAGEEARLVREIRLMRNPRLLDAHEQLVIGSRALWFGDSMRRDPLKRDAYESLSIDDAAATRRARATFEKLWAATEPLYLGRAGVLRTFARTLPR